MSFLGCQPAPKSGGTSGGLTFQPNLWKFLRHARDLGMVCTFFGLRSGGIERHGSVVIVDDAFPAMEFFTARLLLDRLVHTLPFHLPVAAGQTIALARDAGSNFFGSGAFKITAVPSRPRFSRLAESALCWHGLAGIVVLAATSDRWSRHMRWRD